MADAPPQGKRKRGRPRKDAAPKLDPKDLPIEAAAEAAAAAGAAPGDTPPGAEPGGGEPPKRQRNRVTKKGTQAIEDGLREILQMPSVPASIFGDQWAAQHFLIQGAAFANKIAVVSERNPVLRSWCDRALQGESIAVLLMSGMMYAGPALLHFGVVPGGELLGVPVLAKRRQAAPPPPAGAPADAPEFGREEPAAQPYGGEPVFAGENGDGPPVWSPT